MRSVVAWRAACRPGQRAVTGVAPQGGVSCGGAFALAQAAQHPLHTDALQLQAVKGPARREGGSSAMDSRRSRAQVNFAVRPERLVGQRSQRAARRQSYVRG